MTLSKHFKQKRTNKTTIILMVVLIALFSIVSPLQTFCANDRIYSISADLNDSVIEELDEIDFSGFNDTIDEFNSKNTNIFSIEFVFVSFKLIISLCFLMIV